MREVEPAVFLISRPSIDLAEMARYLETVGGSSWMDRIDSEGGPAGETLAEFMGRLCYRSWAPGLNANVTSVRSNSTEYLENILRSAHGSVLEHMNYSFVFQNVSRVFTHELVRHRAGTAISQESLRYVRLTDLRFSHPDFVLQDSELLAAADELLASMERFQALAAQATSLDDGDFGTKKIVTSGARRYAPEGVATTIGWSANVRALRHIVALRTDPSAEQEIRVVFAMVGELMRRELPALFADFEVADNGAWIPAYPKV
ncbi:flavin-dependent thymidylate synthase [Nocardioides baekrokdamisoli]|uniref:FAD-dependent thymidylate synthase n=1 Tax=Nocardioides baekrokdamisoli TaxID=1804624 RepID=A0A3G9IBS3_9ACTN|nr:FAD-dependent thymidylate synthase [Nocardioides baekrokdamisoli]BBH15772.1 flavin-dependent thymidylate synthase [Nocardioides baekrokdamisoli]